MSDSDFASVLSFEMFLLAAFCGFSHSVGDALSMLRNNIQGCEPLQHESLSSECDAFREIYADALVPPIQSSFQYCLFPHTAMILVLHLCFCQVTHKYDASLS